MALPPLGRIWIRLTGLNPAECALNYQASARERERERERGNIEMTNNEEFADDSKGQSLLIASALY